MRDSNKKNQKYLIRKIDENVDKIKHSDDKTQVVILKKKNFNSK